MPNRSDILMPYLNYLLKTGKEGEIEMLTRTILRKNVNDPVGLWFSGIVYLNDPDRKKLGYQRMKLSLIMGIQDLMPVPMNLIKILKEESVP